MTCHLLADIGGTRARFALLDGERLGPIESMTTGAYGSVEEAIRHFLNGQPEGTILDRAVIAAAGPVSGGRCKLTNAPWTLESERLRQILQAGSVSIVNDLEALAWAVPRLGEDGVVPIGGGNAAAGQPVAVIAPGTGLGVACYLPGFDDPRALASEGGHATLAADNEGDDRLIGILRRRFEHVSAERVLSGRGLVNLHAAVAEQHGARSDADAPTAEEIVRQATGGGSAHSSEALAAFCAFLGSFAGDMALTFAARGGVLLAGGMAPHIVGALQRSDFRERFVGKGRFSDYVAHIPTGVIVRPEPTFLGLVALATREPA